jgi:dolichol-phosphate mannosyltransferase
MSPPSTLHVVVPVFNEFGNLDRLFGSFRTMRSSFEGKHRVRFVMVDDGSTDGTADRVLELKDNLELELLKNTANQGPGAAFARAFEHLSTRLAADDWVLTLEGDNTSRSELIGQMFRRAEEGYDVILASPYMYGGGITNTSPMRVFLSHMANAFVKELLGAHGILTMSSFFRLHRAPVLMQLQACYGPAILERPGFECMVEMLLKMMYLGVTMSEVPMVLDTSIRMGKSKMKLLRTIRGYIALGRETAGWRRRVGSAIVRARPELSTRPTK